MIDTAMILAAGRGERRVFDPAIERESRRRLRLTAELRNALAQKEFALHYQPKVEIATGRIIGMEALLRWHHPERGPVSPAAFISVAEESGHIRALGEFVLHRACADMRRWRDLVGVPAASVLPARVASPQPSHELVARLARLSLDGAAGEPLVSRPRVRRRRPQPARRRRGSSSCRLAGRGR